MVLVNKIMGEFADRMREAADMQFIYSLFAIRFFAVVRE